MTPGSCSKFFLIVWQARRVGPFERAPHDCAGVARVTTFALRCLVACDELIYDIDVSAQTASAQESHRSSAMSGSEAMAITSKVLHHAPQPCANRTVASLFPPLCLTHSNSPSETVRQVLSDGGGSGGAIHSLPDLQDFR